MKPLIVLLSSFILALIVLKLLKKEVDFALAARISMSLMLCFTAIGHFAFTQGMTLMIPPFIPFKTGLIYFTGIFEILLAIGLLIPQFKVISGWALVIFLVIMLPANIYASIHRINFEKASFDGPGIVYLWFRIPLQIVFIIWTYLSAIRVF